MKKPNPNFAKKRKCVISRLAGIETSINDIRQAACVFPIDVLDLACAQADIQKVLERIRRRK
jgi:hypothetical protein